MVNHFYSEYLARKYRIRTPDKYSLHWVILSLKYLALNVNISFRSVKQGGNNFSSVLSQAVRQNLSTTSSNFSTWNLKLDPRSSIIETRDSILETPSSKVSRFENRVSRFEMQVTVNLLFSGTVYTCPSTCPSWLKWGLYHVPTKSPGIV